MLGPEIVDLAHAVKAWIMLPLAVPTAVQVMQLVVVGAIVTIIAIAGGALDFIRRIFPRNAESRRDKSLGSPRQKRDGGPKTQMSPTAVEVVKFYEGSIAKAGAHLRFDIQDGHFNTQLGVFNPMTGHGVPTDISEQMLINITRQSSIDLDYDSIQQDPNGKTFFIIFSPAPTYTMSEWDDGDPVKVTWPECTVIGEDVFTDLGSCSPVTGPIPMFNIAPNSITITPATLDLRSLDNNNFKATLTLENSEEIWSTDFDFGRTLDGLILQSVDLNHKRADEDILASIKASVFRRANAHRLEWTLDANAMIDAGLVTPDHLIGMTIPTSAFTYLGHDRDLSKSSLASFHPKAFMPVVGDPGVYVVVWTYATEILGLGPHHSGIVTLTADGVAAGGEVLISVADEGDRDPGGIRDAYNITVLRFRSLPIRPAFTLKLDGTDGLGDLEPQDMLCGDFSFSSTWANLENISVNPDENALWVADQTITVSDPLGTHETVIHWMGLEFPDGVPTLPQDASASDHVLYYIDTNGKAVKTVFPCDVVLEANHISFPFQVGVTVYPAINHEVSNPGFSHFYDQYSFVYPKGNTDSFGRGQDYLWDLFLERPQATDKGVVDGTYEFTLARAPFLISDPLRKIVMCYPSGGDAGTNYRFTFRERHDVPLDDPYSWDGNNFTGWSDDFPSGLPSGTRPPPLEDGSDPTT